jgi:hypothetical protein
VTPKTRRFFARHALGGAGLGAAVGGLTGAAEGAFTVDPAERRKSFGARVAKGAAIGGGLGSVVGAGAGLAAGRAARLDQNTFSKTKRYAQNRRRAYEAYREQARRNGGGQYGQYGRRRTSSGNHADHLKTLGLTGNERTRAEVNRAYKNYARQHHPDKPTGSTAKMQAGNDAMDNLRSSPWFNKLGFAQGFTAVTR